jgi:uncharacterized protein (DUF302 family)
MTGELKVATVSRPVAETVASFTDALAERGIQVFATIDHGAGATQVGLELGDEVVIIFGNPAVGTKLMQADREVGIELPLRILVWSESGTTRVGYSDPHELAARYDLASASAVLDGLSGLLEQLVAAVA